MIGEKGVISCGVYGLNAKLYRKGKETIHLKTDLIYNKSNNLDTIHHQQTLFRMCHSSTHNQLLDPLLLA